MTQNLSTKSIHVKVIDRFQLQLEILEINHHCEKTLLQVLLENTRSKINRKSIFST